MKFSDVIFGVMTALTLIFTLFPSTLDEARKMDSYRLIVFCILGICIIYWIYFAIQHSNLIKGLINTKKRVRVIRNPTGYCYLVEGNTCSHIPDPPTFEYLGSYLGFQWSDLETMEATEIKRRFNIGKQLPSIRLHFPKIENGKVAPT